MWLDGKAPSEGEKPDGPNPESATEAPLEVDEPAESESNYRAEKGFPHVDAGPGFRVEHRSDRHVDDISTDSGRGHVEEVVAGHPEDDSR